MPRPDRDNRIVELQRLIRSAGLRSTGPRVAALRILEKAKGPQSHADIHELLAPEGYDRATVYRNLVDLAEAGILTRTDHGDHVWRFEFKRHADGEAKDGHAHFVCTDCGDVSCLPADQVRVTPGPGVPRALALPVEIQIKGRCDDCVE